MNAHDRNDVEELGDDYVLVCGCGWRSSASPSAARVGQEWDQHRRDHDDGS